MPLIQPRVHSAVPPQVAHHLAHVFHVFFHWPDGGVWSNLIASALWVIPAAFYGWWHLRCKVLWCFRPGQHPVKGTTWKVCSHHHVHRHHLELFRRHARRHPERLAHGESHDTV